MPCPCISLLDARQLDCAVALFSAQLKEHGITTPADDLRSVVQSVVADPGYGFTLFAPSVPSPFTNPPFPDNLWPFDKSMIKMALREAADAQHLLQSF
jgi:hypothetical protein